MDEKIYAGNGKVIDTQYGKLLKVTLDLQALFDASKAGHGFEARNSGKKMITVNVSARRDGADQYGNTHTIVVDTWKPDPNRAQQSTPQGGGPAVPPPSFEDDIPFSMDR